MAAGGSTGRVLSSAVVEAPITRAVAIDVTWPAVVLVLWRLKLAGLGLIGALVVPGVMAADGSTGGVQISASVEAPTIRAVAIDITGPVVVLILLHLKLAGLGLVGALQPSCAVLVVTERVPVLHVGGVEATDGSIGGVLVGFTRIRIPIILAPAAGAVAVSVAWPAVVLERRLCQTAGA